MLAPQFGATPSAIAREGLIRGEFGETYMSGLALVTGVLIVFVSVVSLIGVSSLFTLTRL